MMNARVYRSNSDAKRMAGSHQQKQNYPPPQPLQLSARARMDCVCVYILVHACSCVLAFLWNDKMQYHTDPCDCDFARALVRKTNLPLEVSLSHQLFVFHVKDLASWYHLPAYECMDVQKACTARACARV
jgi:nitrous oxide reductase accessory protein NosL